MPEIIRTGKVYDVCVIGSGAAGGAAAKVLRKVG
jgi:choline dehydrogenase-like flavoprotein